eukprot:3927852-Pleurochrysis_carterae.AAC.2
MLPEAQVKCVRQHRVRTSRFDDVWNWSWQSELQLVVGRCTLLVGLRPVYYILYRLYQEIHVQSQIANIQAASLFLRLKSWISQLNQLEGSRLRRTQGCSKIVHSPTRARRQRCRKAAATKQHLSLQLPV